MRELAELLSDCRDVDPGGPTHEERELLTLRSLLTVYHRLAAVAVQSVEVSAITELLASHLALSAFVFSDTLDVVAASAPPGAALSAGDRAEVVRTSPPAVRVIRAVGGTRRSVRSPDPTGDGWLVVAPIVVGAEVEAYLVSVEQSTSVAEEATSLLVTEQAATMCGIVISRDRALVAAAGRVRDDLLEGLLFARSAEDEELERWANHLGFYSSRRYRVLSVTAHQRGEPPGAADQDAAEWQKRLFTILKHFFVSRAPGGITGVRPDEVVVVVPEQDEDGNGMAVRISKECVQYVGQLFVDAVVTVGIGGVCNDTREVSRSYREARWTIEAAERLGRPGQVISFESLGIHRLLLQVPDLDQLRTFAMGVLGGVVAYEQARSGELLKTLSCFFQENGSPERMAQRLHVHPNTVAYRLRRIEELTSLSFDDHSDRLMADVALEIIAVLEGKADG